MPELAGYNFKPLETQRLLLGKVDLDQSKQIYEMFSDPRIHQYLGTEPPQTYEEELAYLAQVAISYNKPGRVFSWFISIKGCSEIIGVIGLHATVAYHPYRALIGYWLSPAYWGQGIMSEAVEEIVRFAFECEANLTSLQIDAYEPNLGSQKVAQKCDFTLDGVLREGAYKNGQPLDRYLYTLLKSEYEQMKMSR